ncbi:Re/Si-specific NAD(P)(+) transhydrogenase subunit beta, partial [Salmonella enterica subsp. enterica serovar Senftenberg]|nr:Re/Si-specific NAD(P)(+) transhydrogenase subunit beta [Salmonella enterica subsp. enterica serovar Senftenberg]
MTTLNLVQAAYIVSAVLFVLSLAGLSKHEQAKEGNAFGVTGMVIALVATIWLAASQSANALLTLLLVLVAMAIGGSIGLWRARVVEMTQMPELVAMLHSFVGLAAVLVGFNSYLEGGDAGTGVTIHLVEVFLGVFIGAVTFTGSIVAFLKLSARIRSSPLMLPARHWLNLAALVVSAFLLVWFLGSHSVVPLLLMTVVALAFGWHLVASIGGGDMPVVVSMLNSYSGWAAAAAGFM